MSMVQKVHILFYVSIAYDSTSIGLDESVNLEMDTLIELHIGSPVH